MNIEANHITSMKRRSVEDDEIIWKKSKKERDYGALILSLASKNDKRMCIESSKPISKKMYVRKRSLIEIKSQNEERWKKIENLQKRLNVKKNRSIDKVINNNSRSNCDDWGQSMESAALKFEVEKIRKHRNNQIIHEKLDETLTQSKSNEYSQSLVHYARLYYSSMFPNEILSSYQELSQLHATLDRVILADDIDKGNPWSLPVRIHQMKRNIQYQEKLHEVLTLKLIRSNKTNNKNNIEKPTNGESVVTTKSTFDNTVVIENEQVRNKLNYVATMYQKKKRKNSSITNKSINSKSVDPIFVLGPRNIQNNTKKDSQALGSWCGPTNLSTLSEATDSNEYKNSNCPFWSLDQLILKLIEQSIKHPNDPYLMFNNLENDPSDLIDKKHVRFLLQCGVIKTHEKNNSLITMIDYNGK